MYLLLIRNALGAPPIPPVHRWRDDGRRPDPSQGDGAALSWSQPRLPTVRLVLRARNDADGGGGGALAGRWLDDELFDTSSLDRHQWSTRADENALCAGSTSEKDRADETSNLGATETVAAARQAKSDEERCL
jgi:hypothetical protein